VVPSVLSEIMSAAYMIMSAAYMTAEFHIPGTDFLSLSVLLLAVHSAPAMIHGYLAHNQNWLSCGSCVYSWEYDASSICIGAISLLFFYLLLAIYICVNLFVHFHMPIFGTCSFTCLFLVCVLSHAYSWYANFHKFTSLFVVRALSHSYLYYICTFTCLFLVCVLSHAYSWYAYFHRSCLFVVCVHSFTHRHLFMN